MTSYRAVDCIYDLATSSRLMDLTLLFLMWIDSLIFLVNNKNQKINLHQKGGGGGKLINCDEGAISLDHVMYTIHVTI